ncbi:hypothetical protein [Streptomyces sp. CoH17]|uniref:hypothetical protein n=1 Tax=Streptomyces sp. CoH17 TaxID=2992806 RepID=UPI00226F2875|nr:hypothetical protein [Streptomyces sp. CoH17]
MAELVVPVLALAEVGAEVEALLTTSSVELVAPVVAVEAEVVVVAVEVEVTQEHLRLPETLATTSG